jgi:DNA transformation protein
MAQADEFTDHCIELLAPLGAVLARRMFGGHGLYLDELFVAIIAFGQLWLKADAETASAFEQAGCAPFRYDKQGQVMTMAYFAAPEEAMESPALMQPWARLALQAALRARAAKPAASPKESRLKPPAAAKSKKPGGPTTRTTKTRTSH